EAIEKSITAEAPSSPAPRSAVASTPSVPMPASSPMSRPCAGSTLEQTAPTSSRSSASWINRVIARPMRPVAPCIATFMLASSCPPALVFLEHLRQRLPRLGRCLDERGPHHRSRNALERQRRLDRLRAGLDEQDAMYGHERQVFLARLLPASCQSVFDHLGHLSRVQVAGDADDALGPDAHHGQGQRIVAAQQRHAIPRLAEQALAV